MDAFIHDTAALDGIGEPVPAARADISHDGTIAVARLPLTVSPGAVPLETGNRLIDMAEQRSGDGVRVALGGQAIGNAQRGEVSSETVGFAIAAPVLLLTFGSIVASGRPIATALFGLGISTALIGMLAAVVASPSWPASVAAIVAVLVVMAASLTLLPALLGFARSA